MYKLGPTNLLTNTPNCIVRLIDNTAIPFDPANTDYQQYLAWLEAGNTVLPADEGAQ